MSERGVFETPPPRDEDWRLPRTSWWSVAAAFSLFAMGSMFFASFACFGSFTIAGLAEMASPPQSHGGDFISGAAFLPCLVPGFVATGGLAFAAFRGVYLFAKGRGSENMARVAVALGVVFALGALVVACFWFA